MDKSEITGAVGTPAPPGAPHEVTAPGSERPTAEQVETALANEVELPPWNPGADGKLMTVEEQAIFLGKTIPEIKALRAAAGILDANDVVVPANPAPSPPAKLLAGVILDARGKPVTSSVMPVPPRPVRKLRTVHKPPSVVTGESLEYQEAPHGMPDRTAELDGLTEAIVEGAVVPGAPVIPPLDPTKHQPAASNTDSPGRGTPPPMSTLPEGKRITGGFGDPAEAEYYPLDGTELRELVNALMDSIHARMEDDLRFSMAITYPRVAARVIVEVDAFAQDETMTVEKVMAGDAAARGHRTPMEVARLYGDQVVFCVTAERAEMTEDGQSIAPPNQTRQELGLPVPRKTAVQTPGGRMLVDVRR